MWYKFSERKPNDTDAIILRQSAFLITEGNYQNETNTFFSFDENTYDPFTPDDDNEWCLSPEGNTKASIIDENIWYNIEEKKPEEDSYIVIRLFGKVHEKYFEGIFSSDTIISKSGKTIQVPTKCVWTYLPQKWKESKKEFHIWLDWEGCMPKLCCMTYVATKKKIDAQEEYIATTQTSFDLQKLMSSGYRIFVHIKTAKMEIDKESLGTVDIKEYIK